MGLALAAASMAPLAADGGIGRSIAGLRIVPWQDPVEGVIVTHDGANASICRQFNGFASRMWDVGSLVPCSVRKNNPGVTLRRLN